MLDMISFRNTFTELQVTKHVFCILMTFACTRVAMLSGGERRRLQLLAVLTKVSEALYKDLFDCFLPHAENELFCFSQ